VLFEIADVEPEPQQLGRAVAPLHALTEPRVTRMAQLIADDATPATLAWDIARPALSGSPCPPREERWDLTITPTLGAGKPQAVRLEVVLQPAPPLGQSRESWHVPKHRRVHTTVVVGDQQPVILGMPGSPDTVLAITPYAIRDDGDLRQIFHCKMQARAADARSAPTRESPQRRRWKGK
jgi:hypothetical protein